MEQAKAAKTQHAEWIVYLEDGSFFGGFESEAEAMEHFNAMLSGAEWAKKYAKPEGVAKAPEW